MNKKSCENLKFNQFITLYIKIPDGVKHLCIIFDKVDRYIRKYDRTIYLSLFPSDYKYERVFDRIRYFIVSKSNISDVYSDKYRKIKIKSHDDLLLEKNINYV